MWEYQALYELAVYAAEAKENVSESAAKRIDAVVENAMKAIQEAETLEAVEQALADAKDAVVEAAKTTALERLTDIDENQWYYEAVKYVVENGYMMGTSETTFDANKNLTRAEFVTVLYRIAGSPSVSDMENPFDDVQSDTWYTDAVIWAASEGIVKGMGAGCFAPSIEISREQVAVILFNYTKSETVAENHLENYPDSDSVSAYALDAMNWAVASGLIHGNTGRLLPQGTATRAQIATILMRYLSEKG